MQHTDCRPKEGYLPTRVLDVGEAEDNSGMSLHCNRGGETGRYMALSHRWAAENTQRPLKLLRSNLKILQKGQSFANYQRRSKMQ
jgi:hypothetical protein